MRVKCEASRSSPRLFGWGGAAMAAAGAVAARAAAHPAPPGRRGAAPGVAPGAVPGRADARGGGAAVRRGPAPAAATGGPARAHVSALAPHVALGPGRNSSFTVARAADRRPTCGAASRSATRAPMRAGRGARLARPPRPAGVLQGETVRPPAQLHNARPHPRPRAPRPQTPRPPPLRSAAGTAEGSCAPPPGLLRSAACGTRHAGSGGRAGGAGGAPHRARPPEIPPSSGAGSATRSPAHRPRAR
jgi:hypothetical protein